jgi:OTU domain-containing protein 6
LRLESELKLRHETELKELEESTTGSSGGDTNVVEEEVTTTGVEQLDIQNKPAKKNKAKLRKEKKMQEFEDARKKAGEESQGMINHKELEDSAIQATLDTMNLKLKLISADGHCLYNSLAHQLSIEGKDYTYRDLRSLASKYIRENADDFWPFMIDDNGDMMDQGSFS